MSSLFQQYVESFVTKYGTTVVNSMNNREFSDIYITYEEVTVSQVLSGATFTATLNYIPMGYKYNRKIGSTGTYRLVYVGVPEMATEVNLTNLDNGVPTTTKQAVTAQPHAEESKSYLATIAGPGTVLSLLNVGITSKNEYLVYAFTKSVDEKTELSINRELLLNGNGILIPTKFLISSARYNQNKDFIYQKTSNNNYTTVDIIDDYRSAMDMAESNEVGIWSISIRPLLEKWIQDNKRYY